MEYTTENGSPTNGTPSPKNNLPLNKLSKRKMVSVIIGRSTQI